VKKQLHTYNTLLFRYQKYVIKLQRLIACNKNVARQKVLVRNIIRLYHKLSSLDKGLKKQLVAGFMFASTISVTPSLVAQTFFADPIFQPFNIPNRFNSEPFELFETPVSGDLDNDGDLDLLASFEGSLLYFENTGAIGVPLYSDGVPTSLDISTPAVGDLDGDGDLDLIRINYGGSLSYYENSGTPEVFSFEDAVVNPFNFSDSSIPDTLYVLGGSQVIDLDADGDLDILLSSYSGSLIYFENIGTSLNPQFADAIINPFQFSPVAQLYAAGDMDNDGDIDIFGTFYAFGTFFFIENIGTLDGNPLFSTPQMSPFNITGLAPDFSPPHLADFDGDGDLDLLIENYADSASFLDSSELVYYENIFNDIVDEDTVFIGPFDAGLSEKEFGDIDDDGDLDFLAITYSYPYLFGFRFNENIGDSENPIFSLESVSAMNIPSAYALDRYLSLVDIDGDSDLDIITSGFVNDYTSSVFAFYENIGSVSEAVFDIRELNPFGLDVIIPDEFPRTVFKDLDNDGDLDLFSGSSNGDFYYRENSGDVNSPVFEDPILNPFGVLNIGETSVPEMVDFDEDGDLDLFVGVATDNFFYFENIGSIDTPLFDSPSVNPFGLTGLGAPIQDFGTFFSNEFSASAPALVDINNDGDLDLFSSYFFENMTNTSFLIEGNDITLELNEEGFAQITPEDVLVDSGIDFDYVGLSQRNFNTDDVGLNIPIIIIARKGTEVVHTEVLISVEEFLSVDDVVLQSVELYPNPATTALTILNQENIPLQQVQLLDVTGKVVSDIRLDIVDQQVILDISKLASGLYMVKIESNQGSSVRKLIKK